VSKAGLDGTLDADTASRIITVLTATNVLLLTTQDIEQALRTAHVAIAEAQAFRSERSTPMRRMRSPCCARAAIGHAAALPSR
jgi:hypothetical protein